jgi:hypothetical protein
MSSKDGNARQTTIPTALSPINEISAPPIMEGVFIFPSISTFEASSY